MSVVTVLTPNGRRQNVKITPNTTLLQVLEEVCLKHGFKPEDYDIRHHNKIMDVSAIFRFSGLPNNAQLEMTEAIKQRSESPVVLGLHLESGDRLTGEFSPSDNLWNVIITLNPEEAKSFPNPVVIYMRKEVCGKENLEKTTLRSLGLTGGRAILRFFNRTPEELRTQANVSAVLSRTTVSSENKANVKSGERHSKENSREPLQTTSSEKANPVTKDKENKPVVKKSPVEEKADENEESPPSAKSPKEKKKLETVSAAAEKINDDDDTTGSKERKKDVTRGSRQTQEAKPKMSPENDSTQEKKVILLGDRNAVAYNLNSIKPAAFEEEPDDFYDLTEADAKLLLRDAKQLCAELEEAPLMTSAQRELERNKKILSLLNQYKKTVLRIKFPDRTVLQGTFSSVEKISAVEKFVADYLEDPDFSFYLYTTPPKQILKSENNLLESNCVPCAVLYFGFHHDGNESKQFLRMDILKKLSSPSAAALTAYQSRGMTVSKKAERVSGEESEAVASSEAASSSNAPSTSAESSQGRQTREPENSPPFKVPKWFKMQK